MSELSDPKQAAAWVADWRAYYAKRHAGPVGLAKRLRTAATEQRANLRGCRRAGFQGVKGRAAYEQSVAMLERAATEAETAAEVWRTEEAERKRVAEVAAEERRAELMRKYPKVPR